MGEIEEYDIVIIGKTPAALMISINLSFHGYKICILNISLINTYPPYIFVPHSAFKAMNIPYKNFEFPKSLNSSKNYIERIIRISRIKHLFKNRSDSEHEKIDINEKMYFDNRLLITFNTKKFLEYLITVGKSRNIDIKDIRSYEVLSQQNNFGVKVKKKTNEEKTLKCKFPILMSIRPEKSGECTHQQIIVPKLLTDGLDIFYDNNKYPYSYIYVFSTKNETILNFTGKNILNFNLKDNLNDFLIKYYNYKHLEPVTEIFEYKTNFMTENQPFLKDKTILVGSALSLTHPLSYGYFSSEIQSSLILSDVFLDWIDNKLGIDINVIIREYKKRLIDLPFFEGSNFTAGKDFYDLKEEETKALLNMLNFHDLSSLSLGNRLMLNVFLFFNKTLRRKKNTIFSIYRGYKISRKWF